MVCRQSFRLQAPFFYGTVSLYLSFKDEKIVTCITKVWKVKVLVGVHKNEFVALKKINLKQCSYYKFDDIRVKGCNKLDCHPLQAATLLSKSETIHIRL